MKLEPLENIDQILAAARGKEMFYMVVIEDDFWNFFDPLVKIYLEKILADPDCLVDVYPIPGESTDMFIVYKFAVSLN